MHHHDADTSRGGSGIGSGMIELTDAATTVTTTLPSLGSSGRHRHQQQQRFEIEPLVKSSSPDGEHSSIHSSSSSSASSSSTTTTTSAAAAAAAATVSLDSHGMPKSRAGSSTTASSSSHRQVVINIIISFVGAGLMGIPYAFAQSGWALGAAALCTVSALNVYAMLLLPVVRQRLVVVVVAVAKQQQKQKNRQRKRQKQQKTSSSSSNNKNGHSVLPQHDEDEDDDDSYKENDDYDDYENHDTEHQADGIVVVNHDDDDDDTTTNNTRTTTPRTDNVAAADVNVDGYGDVARLVMGPTGESVVNWSLAVSQTGFATAYIIFIAANLQKLAHIPRGWTCLLCIPGLSLLVQAADMKTLAWSSLFANLANLLGLSSVLFVDVETLERPHPDDTQANTVYAVQWSGLLFVMAVTLYSMEGVGLVLSLEQSCREPLYFSKLLSRTVGGITLFMAVFGCAGYWAFATHTQAPITLNLGTESTAATIVQSALCFALYLTYVKNKVCFGLLLRWCYLLLTSNTYAYM